MSHDVYGVIRKPLVTEKNMHRVEARNEYTFEVKPGANKVEIRTAVEALFKVKVAAVRTITVKGKRKRHGANHHFTSGKKKAIVKLKEGSKIELI
ncbi:MAG: 50S ribosomal protein L23 [Planctomycetota bacterium]